MFHTINANYGRAPLHLIRLLKGEDTMESLHVNWPLLAALLTNGILWAIMLLPMGL